MARAAKLKVFCAPAGFYDAIVAAPSQKAALRIWGATTDLFAAGRASIVEDEALIAEALATPGQVVKRSRGDEAAMLGPEPAEPFEPKRQHEKKAPPKRDRKAATKPPAPPPDRSKLDEAERALLDAERELTANLDALTVERADLDRRGAETRSAGDARLAKLSRAKKEAEAAYERAARRR